MHKDGSHVWWLFTNTRSKEKDVREENLFGNGQQDNKAVDRIQHKMQPPPPVSFMYVRMAFISLEAMLLFLAMEAWRAMD